MQIDVAFTKAELIEHIERLEGLMLQCPSDHTERRTFYCGQAAGQIELLNWLGVLTADEAKELHRRLAAHWTQSFGEHTASLPFTPRRAAPKAGQGKYRYFGLQRPPICKQFAHMQEWHQ
jgi:hypothetical protein